MPEYLPDPASIAGKALDIAERTPLLVIGAGAAGVAAAMEAVRHGLGVVLVDENPISADVMGEDLPLLFGGRASGAVRNRNAMMETLADDADVVALFEAGVDVRLGTVAWGLYAGGPSVGWLPGLVAGLSDGERSWLIACDRVIVAAGCRDLGLAFPGWELPGVVGASAVHRLAARYGALDARRAVILGTTVEAFAAATVLGQAGVAVLAMVEQAPAPVGPPDLVEASTTAGVPILCGHVVQAASGRPDGGIERVVAVRVDADGRHVGGSERSFACDTVVLGIGAVPSIELIDALGGKVAFVAERGGYVPVLDDAQRCSVPGVSAVGDAAGVWPQKSLDPEVAREEGRRAARDAVRALGRGTAEAGHDPGPPRPANDLAAYRLAWVKASVVEAEGEPHVCRCEEVTAREILEVRPPRYLGANAPGRNDRDLRTLLGEGPPHPDQVKRLTRAGMGLCQGRRCREQVQALLALGAGHALSEVPLASYRAPVRPLPLRLLGQCEDFAALARHWDVWFGMPGQYAPPSEVPALYTVAGRRRDDTVASE